MFDAAHHGIEALTDVQLCVLPRRDVWALFGAMPGLAFDVTWLGAREESIVDENLASVGRRTAAERVAALIVALYKRAKLLGLVEDDDSFDFPLTQQHIADALGLSLVHTNKTLAKLRRHGDVHHPQRYADADQSAGAGARGGLFRRGDSAPAADLGRAFLAKSKGPGLNRGLSPERRRCYLLELSGTQVVLVLSYLKPGAFFSASLLVSIVR